MKSENLKGLIFEAGYQDLWITVQTLLTCEILSLTTATTLTKQPLYINSQKNLPNAKYKCFQQSQLLVA